MHNIEKPDYVGTLKVFKNGFVFAIQELWRSDESTQIEYITDAKTLKDRLSSINIHGFNYYSYQAPLLYMLQRPHYTPLDVYIASTQLQKIGHIVTATWKGGIPGIHLGYDLSSDTAPSMTIQTIAGHMGNRINYLKIDLDAELSNSSEELHYIKKYCDYEILMLQLFVSYRHDYLDGTKSLERVLNLQSGALGCSCKQQAVALLQARKEPHDREFIPYPKTINILDMPKPIKDHFDKVNKSLYVAAPIKTEYELCGLKVTYSLGGLHGALKNYYTDATNNKVISIITLKNLLARIALDYKLLSRNVPTVGRARNEMLSRLIDSVFNVDGEIITIAHRDMLLQGIIDGMEDEHNALYDPTRARAIYLYSQLLMTDYILKLNKLAPGLKLLLVSTNKIIIEYDKTFKEDVESIYVSEYCKTGVIPYHFDIGNLWLKNEHNYCYFEQRYSDTKVLKYPPQQPDTTENLYTLIEDFHAVGPDLPDFVCYEIYFRLNHNAACIKRAIQRYLATGADIRETIEKLPLNTKQYIVSRTKKLEELTTYYKNAQIKLPDTVRVFATTNKDCYPIFRKTKDQVVGESVSQCPDHCFVTLDTPRESYDPPGSTTTKALRNPNNGGISVLYEDFSSELNDDPQFPVDNSYYIAKAEEWLRPFEENLNK
jgi:hypothetical protein